MGWVGGMKQEGKATSPPGSGRLLRAGLKAHSHLEFG